MTNQPHAGVAWKAFLDAAHGCGERLLGAAPDSGSATESIAYLGRLVSSVLGQMLAPAERTIEGIYYPAARIGGQNPDYRMGLARIDPGGRYRISGRLNGAERVAIGLYTPQPQAGLDLDDYSAAWARDGETFCITIGGEGATMSPKPSTALLMVRELRLRDPFDRAEIVFERLDRQLASPSTAPPGDHAVTGIVDAATAQLVALIDQFIRWSDVITRTRNTLVPMPAELDEIVRGDAETRYCTGHFDLGPDDRLEIEMPETDAGYWMIQATNHWLEPIQGASRNMATIDPESRTVIIAAQDTGRPNWLDTGGRRHGQILARFVGASVFTLPAVRLVKG